LAEAHVRHWLALEPLEARAVPAGVVVAQMSAGVLTLTGDAAANGVTLRLSSAPGPDVELIPDATTTIRTGPGPGVPGQTATLEQYPRALVVRLGAGADTFAVAPGSDLSLNGGATFDLGTGANVLDLATTGFFQVVGRLRVTAGDGYDDVRLTGNFLAGATLTLGDGGSRLRADDVLIDGPTGLRVVAGDGDDEIELTETRIYGALTARLGGGSGAPDTGHRLTLTGGFATSLNYQADRATAKLTGHRVYGPATFDFAEGGTVALDAARLEGLVVTSRGAGAGADVSSTGDVAVEGSLKITAAGRAGMTVGPGFINAERLAVTAGTGDATLAVRDGTLWVSRAINSMTVYQDVRVASTGAGAFAAVADGDLRAGHLTLTGGGGDAAFSQEGGTAIYPTGLSSV
jgi:hypothetical protein